MIRFDRTAVPVCASLLATLSLVGMSLLGSTLLIGCAGPDARGSDDTFKLDTIGDTVVVHTNKVGAWTDAAPVEELRIGAADGAEEYMFANVDAVAVGKDNNIYVLDAQTNDVRRYDAAGKFVSKFGRSGSGPGELKQPHSMAFLPDGRLVIRDFGNARINVYDADGKSLATYPFPAGGFYTGTHMQVDRKGNMYTQVIRERLPTGGWHLGLLRIAPDGTLGDTIRNPYDSFDAPTVRATRTTKSGTSSSSSNVPFSPEAISTFSLDGSWIGGISNRYAIEIHQADGKTRRIERTADPVAVDPQEKADAMEQLTRSLQNTDPGWRWNAEKPGDTKPFFRSINVGADGRMWVLRSTAGRKLPVDPDAKPDDKGRMPLPRWVEDKLYDVFEEDGHFVGSVTLPDRFEPMLLRGDEIYGALYDVDDVAFVVKYRVKPKV